MRQPSPHLSMLRALAAAEVEADRQLAEAVAAVRASGATWYEIAQAVGVHEATAYRRWHEVVKAPRSTGHQRGRPVEVGEAPRIAAIDAAVETVLDAFEEPYTVELPLYEGARFRLPGRQFNLVCRALDVIVEWDETQDDDGRVYDDDDIIKVVTHVRRRDLKSPERTVDPESTT